MIAGNKRGRWGRTATCTCVAVVAIATGVHAQPRSEPAAAPQQHAQAREDAAFAAEFAQGLQAEDEGQFPRALAHYERALARAQALTLPAPRLRCLLALGWTHYKLHDYLRSVEFLKQAVADPALPQARREEAQALITDDMKFLGQLRINIHTPDGAIAPTRIELDGREVSDPRDVPVEPGRRRIRASAPGFVAFVHEITIAAGQSLAVDSVLVRRDAMDGTRVAAWVVGGVAAVSLAVGIGTGTYSLVQHAVSKDECSMPPGCTTRGVQAMDRAIVAGNVSTVTWIIAGVGAGASAYLFWLAGSDAREAGARTRIGMGLASVRLEHAW